MTRKSSIGAIVVAVAGFAGGIFWNQTQDSQQLPDSVAVTKQPADSSWPFASNGSGPSVALEAEPLNLATSDLDASVGRARIEELSGDDQQFFPAAIDDNLGVARVEDVSPSPSQANVIDLTDAERQVWDETLDNLTPKQREELINIRNRVGSVTTPLLPSLAELNGTSATAPTEIKELGDPNLIEHNANPAVPPSADPPNLFPMPPADTLVELTPDLSQSGVVLQVNAEESKSRLLSAAEQVHRESLLNQMTIGYKRSELIITSPLDASDFLVTANVARGAPPAIPSLETQAAKSKPDNTVKKNTNSEPDRAKTQDGSSLVSTVPRTKWTVRIDTSPGRIKQTGNPLDLAIHGRGWFKIDLPDGKTGYTRSGVLGIGKERRLCVRTSDGLLPLSPAVTLPKNVSVSINAFGAVSTSTPGSELEAVGTIRLFDFHNPTQLKRHANGCLLTTELSGEAFEMVMNGDGQLSVIEQGVLELSNADTRSAKEQLSKLQEIAEALR